MVKYRGVTRGAVTNVILYGIGLLAAGVIIIGAVQSWEKDTQTMKAADVLERALRQNIAASDIQKDAKQVLLYKLDQCNTQGAGERLACIGVVADGILRQ